jgi:hypothetical protein
MVASRLFLSPLLQRKMLHPVIKINKSSSRTNPTPLRDAQRRVNVELEPLLKPE